MVQGNKSSANGMYLRKEKFRSNLRKRFLTVKYRRLWNICLQEKTQGISLETFKTALEKALKHLVHNNPTLGRRKARSSNWAFPSLLSVIQW